MPRTGRQYGLKSNGDRRRAQRSREGDARRGEVPHVPPRALRRLVPRSWRPTTPARARSCARWRRPGARDFWQLAALRRSGRQTQNYVPAFLASVLISKNPTHYGFDVALEPPLDVRDGPPRSARAISERSPAAPTSSARGAPGAEPRAALGGHAAPGRGVRAEGPAGHARDRAARLRRRRPTAKPPSFTTHVAQQGRDAAPHRQALRRLGDGARLGQLAVDEVRRSRAARRSSSRRRSSTVVARRRRRRTRQGRPRRPRPRAAPAPKSYQVEERRHALPDRAPPRRDGGGDPRRSTASAARPRSRPGDQLAIPAKGK